MIDRIDPLAEHTALMRPLTLWVLDHALGQSEDPRALAFFAEILGR